jgi:phosphoribosylamine-glycine ligase
MGAYCPCPLISESDLAKVKDTVLHTAVDGLKMEKTPFTGKMLKLKWKKSQSGVS